MKKFEFGLNLTTKRYFLRKLKFSFSPKACRNDARFNILSRIGFILFSG